jgi:hypothetical protein
VTNLTAAAAAAAAAVEASHGSCLCYCQQPLLPEGHRPADCAALPFAVLAAQVLARLENQQLLIPRLKRWQPAAMH